MIRRLASLMGLAIASLEGAPKQRAMSVPDVPELPHTRGRGKHSNNHYPADVWQRRKRRRKIARASRVFNALRAKGKR